jgi:hypothetical protein
VLDLPILLTKSAKVDDVLYSACQCGLNVELYCLLGTAAAAVEPVMLAAVVPVGTVAAAGAGVALAAVVAAVVPSAVVSSVVSAVGGLPQLTSASPLYVYVYQTDTSSINCCCCYSASLQCVTSQQIAREEHSS